ncbi:hypothetical protein L3Y34_000779 [Caenorhabditis briggsae]|uniref:Uncharacterized protein n=1 Tax=Caenorhabditis briggsae TaxID=6238 RepID=A0AAE9IPS3_CAEBR|nr:hypothetical protein L3Y34_000779 [Caenorhabditis briggsae]
MTNTVTTDETITGATTSLSTVSTVSTTLSSDLPPQTPPKIMHGSTRKTKGIVAASDFPPSIKHAAEKWGGETAAKAWLEKTEFSKVKADFEKINSMVVNVEKDCKKWKANSKWNQSEDYPALDSVMYTFIIVIHTLVFPARELKVLPLEPAAIIFCQWIVICKQPSF